MATGYAYRVFGTPTDAKKWTFSAWCKKGTEGTSHIFGGGATGQTGDGHSYLGLIPEFYGTYYDGSSSVWSTISNAKYRDVSGWYHYMFVYDSAQATASNRIKGYINGEQITSFDTATYPSQNYSTMWNNNGITHYLGRRGQSQSFEGSLSHVHFCDGYAYTPSSFGSTDSTTGEWKINISPSVSYGTNGFWLFKNDASMTDQSPNSNNFTLSGSITPTQDCPSNVFATLNPLDKGGDVNTVINGNTSATWNATSGHTIRSTLAVSKGKYYWELNNANNLTVGIVSTEEPIIPTSGNLFPGGSGFGTGSYSYRLTDGYKGNNNTFSSYGSAITTSDILGCALDLDNGKIYWSKNGVWQNSADPANGTNPAFTGISSDKTWSPAYGYVGGGANTLNVNYGNGYFGTTAVSSAGTNASGIGIFEHDCPAGFTALSTKGLNL